MALTILENKDVHTLVNETLKNVMGENTTLLTEDLTNVVDVGIALANANLYENFLEGLALTTSKYIFRFREYRAKAPKVMRDSREYGQLIQKIRSALVNAFLY